MKDRMTLGRDADAAESAALTLADSRATERIYDALEWEREENARQRQVNNAVRRLSKKDRSFVRCVLKGRRWAELGISKQAFYCKLKKVCELLERPVNRGRKRLLDLRDEKTFS